MGLLRAKMMISVLSLLIIHCQGFLLDTGKGQISSSGQFLTESEFLEAKKLLNQEINDLRRDTDKTIALLTTQLKNKFDILEKKLAYVDNNGTKQNNMPTTEYLVLVQKLNEVLNDNADLKRANKIMKNEMVAMRNALSALNNASSEHSRKIEDLQHLVSIKPLHEISVLQQSVKSNSDSIQLLSMHEQARRQDFLALYNMTTDSNRRLTELETNTSGRIIQHQTYMNSQLMNLQTSYNASLKEIKKRMNQSGEQVVLMAQATSIYVNIIQFNDVKFSFGINNLSKFKNSGKFFCEKNGIYLVSVSVSISSSDSDGAFCITHNGRYYSCTRSPHGNTKQSYSNTIVMDLKVNDNVWVVHAFSVERGTYSHFMILKLY